MNFGPPGLWAVHCWLVLFQNELWTIITSWGGCFSIQTKRRESTAISGYYRSGRARPKLCAASDCQLREQHTHTHQFAPPFLCLFRSPFVFYVYFLCQYFFLFSRTNIYIKKWVTKSANIINTHNINFASFSVLSSRFPLKHNTFTYQRYCTITPKKQLLPKKLNFHASNAGIIWRAKRAASACVFQGAVSIRHQMLFVMVMDMNDVMW